MGIYVHQATFQRVPIKIHSHICTGLGRDTIGRGVGGRRLVTALVERLESGYWSGGKKGKAFLGSKPDSKAFGWGQDLLANRTASVQCVVCISRPWGQSVSADCFIWLFEWALR